MKIPYCTCEVGSKQSFVKGYLYFGICIYVIITPPLLYFSIVDQIWEFLVFAAMLWGIWPYYRLEYKRQALFLHHSPKCAARYASLASFATLKAYGPEYSRLQGYKPILVTFSRRFMTEKQARRVFAMLGIVFFILLLGLMIFLRNYT